MTKQHWNQVGKEPDYRFSLANERTFLAWIRTALALLAGSILLEQFASQLQPRGLLATLSIALSVLATWICGSAYSRWKANQIAMRQGDRLPQGRMIIVVTQAVAFVAGLCLLLLLWPLITS